MFSGVNWHRRFAAFPPYSARFGVHSIGWGSVAAGVSVGSSGSQKPKLSSLMLQCPVVLCRAKEL